MAGGQERILRRRIKSVQGTRKITKAMELIAASQISKSQARLAANRPYRAGMRRLVAEVFRGEQAATSRFFATPEKVETAVVLAIVGDRGLSGAYNSSVLRATERLVTELTSQGTSVRLFTVGKKALAYFRFRGIDVERSFLGFTDRPDFSHAREIADVIARPFLDEEADVVRMISMQFRSAASQTVDVRQLLPLSVDQPAETDEPAPLRGYTEFEPDVLELLKELAPKVLESEVFTALIEGAASFHISQQRAMAAATENADELGRTLTRIMNRARQDSITTEIMEIVGGAEALRSGK